MNSKQKKRRTLEMFQLFGNQNQDSDAMEDMQQTRFRLVIQNLMKNTLTSRQNQVLVLYYYEGMSQKAIAARLGISESSVSHTKKRACANLRGILKSFWS